mmetsp:Transcript_20636/g.25024  ORF Transcript_20636/g.25024 Transcript_20636/m.25024 type:complete len:189 (-) Transcript_20636:1090-1656(-)|eukprot:CAMPEP_0204825286 /NCGR_PEP_ID=MMETSP1346-20131115/3200_1 /ASSEMBLY_ACC=CAM_ASM_000771 /TAXON_ID=215587 /ORGANISM="Aplanochytrium stocchinoi, Strain GSBS06" /LENGTH=188 /DNA_ID=CAMNT_0051952865 /DNA_START=199 /DNA_END=765 /DNA_ORIENTATION=+
MAASIVGEMLVETGHALQRLALRVSGKDVKALDRFRSAGVLLPEVCNSVSVDPSSTIIGGRCTVKGDSTIGRNCVICSEPNTIYIGYGAEIGDDVIINAATEKLSNGLPNKVVIANDVTIGSGSVLQSCLVGDHVKIGEKCIVGEGAYVENGAHLSPGTVVLPGHRIPASQLWAGNPAKYVSDVGGDH